MNDNLKQSVAVHVLCRVLRVVSRSLPRYLEAAKPWSAADDRTARTALARLIADQRLLAQRLAEMIGSLGGSADPGAFPTEFAAFNDVSLEYLLQRIADRMPRDIAVIEHCTAELAIIPAARALAEEVLGNLQGHWEMIEEALQELKDDPGISPLPLAGDDHASTVPAGVRAVSSPVGSAATRVPSP